MKLRVATRSSPLALAQVNIVERALQALDASIKVEIVAIKTKGDRVTDRPLREIGGKGLFTSEVQQLVHRGDADIAVHSLKDIPGDAVWPDGFGLVCFLEREDPRDVIVSPGGLGFFELPRGARIGTTSLRRTYQLQNHRADVSFSMVRGNLQTRLNKLDAGQFDALVLAAAGLRRLDLYHARAARPIAIEVCLPAVGQGTIAIEGALQGPLAAKLSAIEHFNTRIRSEAERNFLQALQGSCHVPVAGHASLIEDGAVLTMDGFVAGPTSTLEASSRCLVGKKSRESQLSLARALGQDVAHALLDRGARSIINEAEAAHLRQAKGNFTRHRWS